LNTLSILIHAPAKVGKSTLTSTAPLPMCVLDAEGGWEFIKRRGYKGGQLLRKKEWNPLTEPPPRWDDTWDVCVVLIDSWLTLQTAYTHLTQSPHDFATIVLDSITEVQRRCKANLAGTKQMQIQDWGTLLNQMDAVIRGFRDLKLLPNSIVCVIFVAETRQENGKWRPYMQGQISVSLPYWVDICGYLYAEAVPDPSDVNGQATINMRRLLIGSHPQFESGERVQGALPDVITNPSITDMMTQIFNTTEADTITQHETETQVST
jgi:hypothetical protein